MKFTDTHCHLNFDLYQEDLEQVRQRAREQGLTRILIPGTTLETSRQAVQMSELYPEVYAAVGVHPNEAADWDEDTLPELRKLAGHPKVVAVGEIGLDFYRDFAPPDRQKEVLRAQLALAGELGLPASLHCRNAFDDLWPILQDWLAGLAERCDRPGVFHSFDGSTMTARMVTAANFYIGISGPVTFTKAEDRQAVVREIPLDKMLLETDAPYLTPHPHRGKRNEPAHVMLIAQKIADIRQITLEDVAEQTTSNADRLFRWEVLD